MSRLLLAGRLSLSLHPSLSLPPSVAVVVSRCTNYSPNRYLPVIALYALTLYALDPLPPPNIAPLCRPLSRFTFLFPRSRHWRVCLLDCPVTLRVSTLSPLLSHLWQCNKNEDKVFLLSSLMRLPWRALAHWLWPSAGSGSSPTTESQPPPPPIDDVN